MKRQITLGRIVQRWRGSVEDIAEDTVIFRVTAELGHKKGHESEVTVVRKALPCRCKPVVGQRVIVETRRVQVDEEYALLTTYKFTPLRKLSKAFCSKLTRELDNLKRKFARDKLERESSKERHED